MGTVYTDKLKPGMVVAEEVRDVNGRLLLGKGNSIQPSHIRIFKIWGITEVKVHGEIGIRDIPVPHIQPELIEKIEKKTLYAFSHVDMEHPAIKELFRLSVEHRSHNGNSEKEMPLPAYGSSKKEMNHHKNFLDKLGKKKMSLPEIPTIVSELNEVISNPLSSAEDIANVVNKSPSLTATLLRIVNSALYGCPSKIDKVSQAVTLIGTKEIFGLAVGISVLAIFKKIPKEIINMYSFLRHSIACGIIARILAAHKNLQHTEQLFISGLLHDLGRVLLYIYFPDDSVHLLGNCYQSNKLLYEEEDDYLGCNHTDIVQYLMQHWKLPLALEKNVFHHHHPSEAQNPIPATIVHIADIMVNALGMGSSGERFVPPLDNAAWEELDLSTSCFEVVIKQATHQFYSLESILHE
ncbi:MAG: HDOD domain-containing protein [Deltaproteobacteria bacterium]|jgi:HD-like signal output (HDOD) protein|nr:HDOD domain-containing protein [Deltaproteobacteria bacterium]